MNNLSENDLVDIYNKLIAARDWLELKGRKTDEMIALIASIGENATTVREMLWRLRGGSVI